MDWKAVDLTVPKETINENSSRPTGVLSDFVMNYDIQYRTDTFRGQDQP